VADRSRTVILAVLLAAAAAAASGRSPATGAPPPPAARAAAPAESAPAESAPAVDPEAILRSVPTSAAYGAHLRRLTEEPHMTGTPANMALADYVRDRFVEYGLEDVTFHDTPALLSFGRSAAAAIVAPDTVRLKLAEDPWPPDKDSYLYADPAQVQFHAYAPSGEATAEVVYANNGGPEDFALLERMGIDVRGRIVLMRYSEPYSYRGYKVYMAEIHGAAASLIYSDPQDDGYARGETYPEGPWGPMSHVQWGSVVYDWLGVGEPFTFHWTRRRDGTWSEGPVRDRQLPKIPSLPLSPEDAALILSRLRGPVVPAGWQGALPFTYHVGPGPVRVHLRTVTDERIGTMRSVLGRIRGREEPDRWVILGNHRDAWIYGAVDPSSGTAAMLETARAMGAALRHGLRPRRTVVFADWDAEEQLLGGSTQWVKDNRDTLLTSAVAYVNVDVGVAGPHFAAGATPALADFVRDVSRAVDDPATGGPIHDSWAARSEDGLPEVGTIVGATDYTAFQEHLGVSCIDMTFDGPYGVYHSQYDDDYWMSRIGDPGFLYGPALARLWGVLAWRLADAPVLPMRYSAYARAVQRHIDAVEAKAAPRHPVRLDRARAAARRWEQAALDLEARPDAGPPPAGEALRALDDRLIQVERAMTDPEGLEGRRFFKHLIYAPQPTYREEVLPRISEAIDRGEWGAIPRYEAQIEAAFDRAAALLRAAAADLPVQPRRPASASSS
jgi:N-acetylated-alpha-linked acidic dipeptidase